MSDVLPPSIVSATTQLAADLTAWSRAHPDALLIEQEQAVLTAVHQALAALLQAVLGLTTRTLAPPQASRRLPCPHCGTPQRAHQSRERHLLTTCGPLQLERPYYYCRRCRDGWTPADRSLGVVPHQQVSPALQAWLVEVGGSAPFREAAGRLARLTGVTVPPETIRQHTEAVGAHLAGAQQAAVAQVERTQEAAEPVEVPPGQLVVEADGVMVRYQDGWHEVKLGAVGGHGDGHTGALSYVAAREPAAAFGRRLLTEAARREALEVVGWSGPLVGKGLAQLRPVVVLGDGAPWIWQLAAEHFGERTEVVDFYHASEHLWAVAHGVFGPASATAVAWAEAQKSALYTQGVAPVQQALAALAPTTPAAVDLVRRERGYFRTNQDRMAYPALRARGLPIGSGAVESGCRHVVQRRLKVAGARWSEAGARAVVAVRCHLASCRPLSVAV